MDLVYIGGGVLMVHSDQCLGGPLMVVHMDFPMRTFLRRVFYTYIQLKLLSGTWILIAEDTITAIFLFYIPSQVNEYLDSAYIPGKYEPKH